MSEPLGPLPGCAVGGLAASDADGVLTTLACRVVAGGFARDTFAAAVLEPERRYGTSSRLRDSRGRGDARPQSEESFDRIVTEGFAGGAVLLSHPSRHVKLCIISH